MSNQAINSGRIIVIWRYHVKSMDGESLQNATIIEGGILGDRLYVFIDQTTGKIASAKMTKV